VGLLTLMAKAGLHIPATSNSKIGFFRDVFADIGDEQSIEQNLSTFSSHMKRIVNIITNVTDKDLVLIDELGAGTDPEEGASLGYAILKKLHEVGCISIVTTHHSKLKEFPYKFEQAVNASVGFDVETLSPTYKLYVGLPGESHAFVIAERLGLPQEILEDARNEVSSDYSEKSEILSKMHEDNRAIEAVRSEIEKEKTEVEKLKEVYEQKLKELEDKKRLEIRKAYEEAQKIIDETKEKMNVILSGLDNYIKSQKEVQEIRNALKNEELHLDEHKEDKVQENKIELVKEIQEGDIVFVPSFKANGIVLQVRKDEGKVIVQMGVIRATLSIKDLELSPNQSQVGTNNEIKNKEFLEESLSMKLDLHGATVEEAIDMLDKYLDKAYLHGMPYVYIVHGKGTGALREAVFDYLRKSKIVAHFETGSLSEGGTGTTIVYFK